MIIINNPYHLGVSSGAESEDINTWLLKLESEKCGVGRHQSMLLGQVFERSEIEVRIRVVQVSVVILGKVFIVHTKHHWLAKRQTDGRVGNTSQVGRGCDGCDSPSLSRFRLALRYRVAVQDFFHY